MKKLAIPVTLLILSGFAYTSFTATTITPIIPPYPGNPSLFLNGAAAWSTPSGSGGGGTPGTLIMTGTPAVGSIVTASDATGTNGAWASGVSIENSTNLIVNGTATVKKAFRQYQGSLTHAGTVTLDFDAANTLNSLTITGALTVTFSNLATNRTAGLLIYNTLSTNASLTWPTGIHGAPYSISTAGKWMRCWFEAWGANDTNVFITTQEDL